MKIRNCIVVGRESVTFTDGKECNHYYALLDVDDAMSEGRRTCEFYSKKLFQCDDVVSLVRFDKKYKVIDNA